MRQRIFSGSIPLSIALQKPFSFYIINSKNNNDHIMYAFHTYQGSIAPGHPSDTTDKIAKLPRNFTTVMAEEHCTANL